MRAHEFLKEDDSTVWTGDPGDLGSTGAYKKKRYVDPSEYGEARRKPFQRWIAANRLTKQNINILFDLKGKAQPTTVFHPPGKPGDIWAYHFTTGSGTSSMPTRMVRKDVAPPNMLY